MKINELIDFIEARTPDTYFANRFPLDSPDICTVVRLTSGFPPSQWTGKKQPSFQVIVRGVEGGDAAAEERAYAVHGSLTNLSNVMIGEHSVVVIRAMNSVPFFVGTDENQRPLYSMNFDCVIRP